MVRRVSLNKEDKLQNLLTSYSSTVELITYEGSLIWSRFAAIFVSHAILFGIIGQIIITNAQILPLKNDYLLILSLIGAALSFFWLLMTIRGFDFYFCWVYCARELEARINALSTEKYWLTTFAKGDTFRSDHEATFSVDNKIIRHKRAWLTRYIKIDVVWATYLSIGLILLLYGCIFVLALQRRFIA